MFRHKNSPQKGSEQNPKTSIFFWANKSPVVCVFMCVCRCFILTYLAALVSSISLDEGVRVTFNKDNRSWPFCAYLVWNGYARGPVPYIP